MSLWRLLARGLAIIAGAGLLVIVGAMCWLVLVGVSIDAGAWRDSISKQLSGALDREVWLRGDVALHLGWRPALRVSRVHVRNTDADGDMAHSFADIDWLYVGQAALEADLMHYVRTRQWRIRAINASNVAVFLESKPDGTNNWTLSTGTGAQQDKRTGETTKVQAQAATEEALDAISRLVVDRVQLNRLHVEYVGPDKMLRLFSVPDLVASAPAGQPVKLNFRGVVDSLFPFDVELTGGALNGFAESEKPWPFTVVTSALGSTLTLDGGFRPDQTEVQLGWGTPDPAVAARILQTSLPAVGATAIAAQIELSPGRIRMRDLRGWMGVTRLTGNLTVRTDTSRPLVLGRLQVPVLDLKPFLSDETPPQSVGVATNAVSAKTPDSRVANEIPKRLSDEEDNKDTGNDAASLADWYRERADSTLNLGVLDQFDADLQLRIGRWLSLPGDVREAGLHVRLNNGQLNAPVSARLAGVNMTGNIQIAGGQREPAIDISLAALDTELDEFARFMFGIQGVRGHLDSMQLQLAGRGRRIRDQVASMSLDLVMQGGQLSYGNNKGEKPVAFGLNALKMSAAPGEALRVTANGSLLDQPLDVSFSGAPLTTLLTRGQSRIDLKARSRTATARVRGGARQREADGEIRTRLFFGVSARDTRDVAAWFGLGGDIKEPFSMAGHFTWDGNRWSIEDGRLGIGRNGVRADISHISRGLHPLVQATVRSEQLDMQQISRLFASDSPQTGSKATATSIIDIPVLPRGLDLTDTDLSLQINHLKQPGLDIRDLRLDATVRDGRMIPSPLSGTVMRVPLQGALALDLRSRRPRGQWWLSSRDVPVGRLLRRLKVADNLDATAGQVSMHLDIRGNRLGEVLASSSLSVDVSGGEFSVRDRNTGAAARFDIDLASVKIPVGKPLQAVLRGRWNQEPVQLNVQAAPALTLLQSTDPVPLNASLSVAGTELELFGKIGRQFGAAGPAAQSQRRLLSDASRELKLNMLVNGERLDKLNRLSGVSLPPWGPFEVTGVVKISDDGYEVPNLSMRIGDSQLDGTGVMLTTESPPRVRMLLNASQLQLNDFRFGDWDPTGSRNEAPATPGEQDSGFDAEAVRRQARQASDQTQALLSRNTLGQFNGGVRLTVNDVRSGDDRLGSGSLRMNVFDGAATIGPVLIQLPDSSARFKLNYAPDPDGIQMRTQINADQFDYGFLARRIDPASDLDGRVSMDIDISANTPRLSQAMQHGSGRINIDVWPEKVQADVFDLWATNLFLTLASRLDPSTASRINCGVIRFRLDDGMLTHEQILLDTTRVRVVGAGSVDFRSETLRLKMEPLPKKAEFFSLATPIEVGGTLSDIDIGANPGDVAGTALRLATSLLWVPLKKIFGRAVPGDGRDICGDPGRFVSAVDATTGQTDAGGAAVPAASAGPGRVAPSATRASARPTKPGAPPRTPRARQEQVPQRQWQEGADDDPYLF